MKLNMLVVNLLQHLKIIFGMVANGEGTTNFANPSCEVDLATVSDGRRVFGDLTNCALNLSKGLSL